MYFFHILKFLSLSVKHFPCKTYFVSFEQKNNNLSSVFRTCIHGETFQSAIIVYNNWTSQEISLYNDGLFVEVEWTVGPIPIEDRNGKEIIVRYDTDIQSQAKFYTDSNGREVLERIRDYRPTWNYTIVEPVSGNYYPINSRIWIKDANRQLTILTGKIELLRLFFLDEY